MDAESLDEENIHIARENFVEVITLVNHRQKLIKIADSSQLGLKVVQKYVANHLADDSDDKKKIITAENRPGRCITCGE